jgi:pilus assembly protein CpaF
MENWRTDLGPLAPLITAETRDLCVDGAGRVWTDDGRGFQESAIALSATDVRRIGVSLIEAAGGRVDDAKPIGDAALSGRVRVHLALPPVARTGPLLSLRFPAPAALGLDSFRFAAGVNPSEFAESTTLIAGVTGSGKTTLASAIIDSLPAAHRVVIVEDLAELNPRHPHTVHVTTRPANADGGGAVSMAALVRESLRMRPDSLVVGEVRGPEIRDFLAAVTAGHHGLSTIHAASLDEVVTRVTILALLAGIPREAIARLAASAIPIVAHCERLGGTVTVTAGRLRAEGDDLRIESL